MSGWKRRERHCPPSSAMTQLQKEPSTDQFSDNECMKKLFVTNPEDDLASMQDRKGEFLRGTCAWVYETLEYRNWENKEDTDILWIQGEPGKGKTMLAISQILAFTERHPHTDEEEPLLVYFFCEDQDERKRDAVFILRSLLFQILDRYPPLFEIFKVEYERYEGRIFTDNNAQQALWRVFKKVLAEVSNPVWFVIDALDECEERTRGILLKHITTLSGPEHKCAADLGSKVKWLLTSRNEVLIRRSLFNHCQEISLQFNTDAVLTDVKSLIDRRVSDLWQGESPSLGLREEIKSILHEKAGDTFLWASLVLEELRDQSWLDAKDLLSQLPSDLQDLYKDLLKRISEQKDSDLLRSILKCALLAERPLRLLELGYLAGLPSRYSGQPGAVAEFVAKCKSLVVIRDNSVHLVHQSAKDFLTASELMVQLETQEEELRVLAIRCAMEEEHQVLAVRCFDYVTSGVFSNGPYDLEDDEPTTELNVLRYPILFWMSHARLSPSEIKQFFEMHSDFFQPNAELFRAWCLTWASSESLGPIDATVLHIAAVLGVLHLVELLLEWGTYSVDVLRMGGITPLSLAAAAGHEPVVRCFLEHGADMTICDSKVTFTPLSRAVTQGQDAVVKLLLESGASTGFRNRKKGETALHHAAKEGHAEIARLLIAHGAKVNARAHRRRHQLTPLHYAAEFGHVAVVQVLIQGGADIAATAGWGMSTALHKASLAGHSEIVQILLDAGLSVNLTMNNWDYPTPLVCAIRSGHENLVRLLLDRGADVTFDDCIYNASELLRKASKEGHATIVFLVEARIAALDVPRKAALLFKSPAFGLKVHCQDAQDHSGLTISRCKRCSLTYTVIRSSRCIRCERH